MSGGVRPVFARSPITRRVFLAVCAHAVQPVLVPVPGPVEHADAEALLRVLGFEGTPKFYVMAHVEPRIAFRIASQYSAKPAPRILGGRREPVRREIRGLPVLPARRIARALSLGAGEGSTTGSWSRLGGCD
jgi:hypothetical protein